MNGRPLVAVLDYGIGNLRSAQKALEKVGADAQLTADPALIADAVGVVDWMPSTPMADGQPDPAWLYFVHSYGAEPVDPIVVAAPPATTAHR